MELIPAIDLIDGKCVRLTKGDFRKKTIYNGEPLEVAKTFEDAGLRRLHIVDLDGASGNSLKNISVLENISKHSKLIVDFGGGLKTTEDIKRVFDSGASMVSLGSIIIRNPVLFSSWLVDFGADKFLPGADVLDKKIKIHGWKEDAGMDIFDFIHDLIKQNVTTIFCTDISKDGMMEGPSTELYEEILKCFPGLNLIASGGVSCYEDLLTLNKAGCAGAIIGKAFYENKITIAQIKEFIKSN